jgi:UDP-glucose 4-epimerase|tara:strand:- start:67 stop:1059 length:993 start_codon:yes stop_codon:yes gene_type:complete
MVKKILVTGGAGFIGSHLCDELINQGNEVYALDNLSNGKLQNLSSRVKFIKGDILDYKTCLKSTKDIDIVYHLACLGVRHSLHNPIQNHKVNAEGTLNMLEASKNNKVDRFFYISTSEVYGDITTFPITEEGLPKPKTVYGSSKLAGENYTYSYNKCFNLKTATVRIFNNYGPRAHYEGDSGEIIPRTIVKAIYNESPVIFGDGLVTRDFFYVKDTAKSLCLLINNQDIIGKTINIGTGVEINMKTLLKSILKEMGLDKKIKIQYLEDRPADVSRLWVDPSKFKNLIGYNQETPFNIGLQETINYYKELKFKGELTSDIELINWKNNKIN